MLQGKIALVSDGVWDIGGRIPVRFQYQITRSLYSG